MKWAAFIEYDQRRLGHAGCIGLPSRQAAIDWLQKAYVHKCLYKSPSMYIEELR